MSFAHDVIKLLYVKEGYLPNYPLHLISETELVDAFLQIEYPVTDDVWTAFLSSTASSFFQDMYPMLGLEVEAQYRALVECIAYHLQQFKQSTEDNKQLPDWVYSYMLGTTIGPHSTELDLDYIYNLFGMTDVNAVFDVVVGEKCYEVSEAWLKKSAHQDTHRAPTIFGEPHVIKALRLKLVEGPRV